jgi:hypothetical protein
MASPIAARVASYYVARPKKPRLMHLINSSMASPTTGSAQKLWWQM